jgi:hypothetical protein
MKFTEKKYDGWTGVNCSDDEMNVDPKEMINARNILFSNFGEFSIRKGLQNPQNAQGNVIKTFYDVFHNQTLYQTADKKLYLQNQSGGSDTLLLQLNTNDILAFAHCSADRNVYFCSDQDQLFYWNGTVVTQVETAVYGEVITWYQNHLFVGSNAGIGTGERYQSRVYISPLGDPKAEWSSDDWLPCVGDGELVGMSELGDHVLVSLKNKSIYFTTGYGLNSWKLTDDNDPTTNVDNSVGCAGKQAYCRVGNELWFMDNKKNIRVVYQTDFDPYRKTYRSEKISKWVNEISDALIEETQMLYFDDKVWVFAPDVSGEKRIVLVFDVLAARNAKLKNDGTMGESWTRFEGNHWKVDSACVRYVSDQTQLVIANNNQICTYGGTLDIDEPIIGIAETKNDDYGKYSLLKRYKLFFGKADILNQVDRAEVFISIDNSDWGYIGDLKPSDQGMILRDDDETVGNATLNAYELGILSETNDDTLGYFAPVATKLRYDNAPFRCKGRVIKHKFEITATGTVEISKISSNFEPRNVK